MWTQIKLIRINLVHGVNATWCGSTWSGSSWLLTWTQFDSDQTDPIQIDPDHVSSVNAALESYYKQWGLTVNVEKNENYDIS